jgi:hypothetical protein
VAFQDKFLILLSVQTSIKKANPSPREARQMREDIDKGVAVSVWRGTTK